MIDFYCGLNEKTWNHIEPQPGKLACVSPVMGSKEKNRKENSVFVPDSVTRVLQDSGAFCDGPTQRLSYKDAFDRQVNHSIKYNYRDRIESVASYDLLIDEKWVDGERHKIRWTEQEAQEAVEITVSAARYLSQHRNELSVSSITLSAQAVTPNQYKDCILKVSNYMDMDTDILGFGGWCITGKMRRRMMPSFLKTVETCVPVCGKLGIKRIHIWGVLLPDALGPLLFVCDQYNIHLSTDSAGPQMKPAFGAYGYGDWTDTNYSRPPVEIRGQERARLVKDVRNWLSNFRNTQYYISPEQSKYYDSQLKLTII